MNDAIYSPKPIIGFVGRSGTGKTTLLTSLIEQFYRQGIRLAVIKHSHHDFEIDKPGKDSYELRKAGAMQSLITSKYRTALIYENSHGKDYDELSEPTLQSSIDKLDTETIDLVLVEGFKQENYPKIEVHRKELDTAFLFTEDENIIALVSDSKLGTDCKIPVFDCDSTTSIADYILQKFQIQRT